MKYIKALDIKKQVDFLIEQLSFTHIKASNIHCIRSLDAKTRAYARIWGMARLFKEVVGIEPHYIIHELMHIPKTFSGALLSHRGHYHQINDRQIEKLYRDFLKKY